MQRTGLKYSIIVITLFLIKSHSLLSWPGDQASLSCIPETEINNPNRTDIENQFNSKAGYAYSAAKAMGLTELEYKAKNQKDAVERVIKIVRKNHDTDYRTTKLGDSLSDLVDFYGAITPRTVFPNYGDAAGTFGGNPLYMDSWNDYMTAGAGILDASAKFNFQNFGQSGNTTLSTMDILGIGRTGDRELRVAPSER